MKTTEIIEIIESIAPPHLAAPWDNCGIQVASQNTEVAHMALCLDPTPQSIQEALEKGATFILSHHPLLIQGRLPHKLDAYHEVLRLLFTHNALLYAAHTSLDINIQGPAGWLAQVLHLKNIKPLEQVDNMPNGNVAGFGIVGDLEKPMEHDDLIEKLKQHLNLNTATFCGACTKKAYSKIAYCPGSGASFMHKAKALAADIFITGDVKYHSALESPLCMLDVGHHSLEEEMMRQLAKQLNSQLSGVRIEFIASTSPFYPVL